MNKPQRRKRNSSKKTITFIACILVLAIAVIGTTVAYLISEAPKKVNEFIPAKVTCEVEEENNGGIKSDVVVRNTGNIDAYIRAFVIVNYVDSNGKIYSVSPVEAVDYTVEWGDEWVKGDDGFWYYTKTVAPDTTTANLINTCACVKQVDGHSLQMQVVATAIQSEPETAAEEAWGIEINNQTLSLQ